MRNMYADSRRTARVTATGVLMATVSAMVGLSLSAGTALASCPNEALRRGPSVALPDCRAYEQVSPVEKGGFDAVSRISFSQYPANGAPNGDAIAYIGNGAFSGALGSLLPDARVSSRGEASWTTKDLTPASVLPTAAGGQPIGYDFSDDLSQMIVRVPQPLVSNMPSGTEALYNLFLRHSDGTYSLINSIAPTTFPPIGCVVCAQVQDLIAFAGASDDFSRIFFETDDILEGTGALTSFPAGGNLYESTGGSVRIVGVLPDGAVATEEGSAPGAGGTFLHGVGYSSAATNAWLRVEHAVSEDGSKVVFQATADGGVPDAVQNGLQEVYDRINGNTTVEVSAPAQGAKPTNSSPQSAQYWAASKDGSLVFFTSSAELTTASKTGSANSSQDLYRYDVETGQTTDLTVDSTPADAETGAGVQGVVGTSNDGAYVYFVATGELIEGHGVDGQPNLYVAHEDPNSHASELRFIATLAPSDSRDWASIPVEQHAYVNHDGSSVAFMSVNSLTGYENRDQNTGAPDTEVYEYRAKTGALTCASCDPSGRLPVGGAFLGATPEHDASTPFHQPRVMSDDGSRLFFSSPSELVRGAHSTHAKIYEYEQDGTGTCAHEEGCVFLISSGANATDDVFLDASSDGSNVFFSTLSQDAKTDTDNLVDVYDARVDGGFTEPAAPVECASGCQTLQSMSASRPSASEFNGVSGNLAPRVQKKVVVTKASKLAAALRACKKLSKKKRTGCAARARKRYDSKATRARTVARRTRRSDAEVRR